MRTAAASARPRVGALLLLPAAHLLPAALPHQAAGASCCCWPGRCCRCFPRRFGPLQPPPAAAAVCRLAAGTLSVAAAAADASAGQPSASCPWGCLWCHSLQGRLRGRLHAARQHGAWRCCSAAAEHLHSTASCPWGRRLLQDWLWAVLRHGRRSCRPQGLLHRRHPWLASPAASAPQAACRCRRPR